MENTVNLNNLRAAFSYKKNKELRHTYYIFKALQHPSLVKVLSVLTNGILKYSILVRILVRNTVFRVFCSGESVSEAFSTIKRLEYYKVKSVLDYVAEGEKTNKIFKYNTEIILENIRKLSREAPGNSISVKFTSLEDPEYFKLINKSPVDAISFGKLRYETFMKRIDSICCTAMETKVVVYFDAEYSNTQDFFDLITEEMMKKYNKSEAIVYNTLQMYLSDRLEYLDHLLNDSVMNHYFPGIKLVRGAYVEKEREIAKRENRLSPVYATKELTDFAFNKALDICLKQHSRVFTCIASHNEPSTLLAIAGIEKYNITDHYKKVKFSQLYGMRDNLTFNLAAKGYNASKYLPYGEVKKAIPYLTRRAQENSSIGEQLAVELVRLKNEITRRKSLEREIRRPN